MHSSNFCTLWLEKVLFQWTFSLYKKLKNNTKMTVKRFIIFCFLPLYIYNSFMWKHTEISIQFDMQLIDNDFYFTALFFDYGWEFHYRYIHISICIIMRFHRQSILFTFIALPTNFWKLGLYFEFCHYEARWSYFRLDLLGITKWSFDHVFVYKLRLTFMQCKNQTGFNTHHLFCFWPTIVWSTDGLA